MIILFISKYQNFKVDLYVYMQCVGCLNCYTYIHVCCECALSEITVVFTCLLYSCV